MKVNNLKIENEVLKNEVTNIKTINSLLQIEIDSSKIKIKELKNQTSDGKSYNVEEENIVIDLQNQLQNVN